MGEPTFTERDREVYEAHSLVECDGMASTRQIADRLGQPARIIARRLVGMQRRGLVQKVDDHYHDDTSDWMLTWVGCDAAEEAVPEHIKFARWLDATEHMLSAPLSQQTRRQAMGETRPNREQAMPIFAIKAKDHLAVDAIRYYRQLCEQHGLREQGEQVHLALREVQQWRVDHPDECKWPDHSHVPAGSAALPVQPSDDPVRQAAVQFLAAYDVGTGLDVQNAVDDLRAAFSVRVEGSDE